MRKNHGDPATLSEAISKLEALGDDKTGDAREFVDKELHAVKEALSSLEPYLKDLKDKVETKGKQAKHEVEHKIQENPWLAVGLVGVLAFVIGWLFGFQKRDK